MDDELMWKALADPIRRQILDRLAAGPVSTGGLADAFSHVSRFAVMKHLGVLEQAQLVTHTREGKRRINHLNAVPLRLAYERWVSRLDDSWAATLTSIGRIANVENLALEGNQPMTAEIRNISIHQEHKIDASKETVWRLLTTRVGDWWSPPYRMIRGNSEMTVELRPNGAMVEQKGDTFILWAVVTMTVPGKTLELDGLSGMVQGRFTFTVVEDGDGTLLTIDHKTIEVETGEPEGYSDGWTHLANGLKQLAEANS